MQFEITDRAAIVFGSEFYAALADGLPGRLLTLRHARRDLRRIAENDIEWATPVLFMRVQDGLLFELRARPT